jgi:DNA-directed RNA polymerase specialized sigma24 family protein
MSSNSVNPKGRPEFQTTSWTTIIHAAATHSADNLQALEKLCHAYWYPVYAFVRRKGYSEHDAEDLTQGFFTHILAKESLKKADQAKGRFRTFLLASLTNFLVNDWDKRDAQKRGGAKGTVTFTDCFPEELYRQEPADNVSPERLFEKRWAQVLLDRVMEKLRQEFQDAGKSQVYDELRSFLTAEAGAAALAGPAQRLGMEENTLKVAVHRMRRRFGDLLRAEIFQTVSSREEVDAEIRNLMQVLAE